MYIYTHCIIK